MMYDLAIIGAGAAGIAAAKYALKYGLKTILIDKDSRSLGGTCLNKGCIPTKLFLNAIKSNPTWNEVIAKKDEVIDKIKRPLPGYLQKKGLTFHWGAASFINTNTIGIEDVEITAKDIIIAAGSSPQRISDDPRAIFAEDLFAAGELGKKVMIVGGGYIGIEFASLLSGFGKDVTVTEKEEEILPVFDRHLTNRLRVILETKGIKIHTGRGFSPEDFDQFDMVILATGREPNIDNLGFAKVGLALDGGGWIKTNKQMKTSVANIYACGDVTGKRLLAYVAEYQAMIAVNNIRGQKDEEDYSLMPLCVFSCPQIAKVGILEDEAKDKGIDHRIVKSGFAKFSSSYVYDDVDGFIKVIVDKDDRIIGAGIISSLAGELIHLFSLAIKNKLKLKDLEASIFIHPTLSEIVSLLLREA